MARTKKNIVDSEAKTKKVKSKTLIPGKGDTVVINADYSNEINFEFRNLEMLDNKIMLGKNTATTIRMVETLYNTLTQAVDPDYPELDFLAVYKDKVENKNNIS